MIIALRGGLVLGGLLLLSLAAGFLFDPAGSAADFGIAVEGAHGLTSVRGDLTSFFLVSAACYIWGAIAKRRDPLIIGAALMLVVLACRLLSLALLGPFEGFIPPMVVECVLGILALIGARVLPETP